MTAKEYLSQYRICAEKETKIQHQIWALRDSKTSLSFLQDGLPKGTVTKTMADYMVELEELEGRLEKAKQKKEQLHDEILSSIQQYCTDSVGIEILCRKYLELQKWDTILKEMPCSRSTVMKKHKKSLNEIIVR